MGRKGLVGYNGKKFYKGRAAKNKPISTAGAGDACASGILAGLIKKKPFSRCLELGMANGGSVVEEIGAKRGLVDEKGAKAHLKKWKLKAIEF